MSPSRALAAVMVLLAVAGCGRGAAGDARPTGPRLSGRGGVGGYTIATPATVRPGAPVVVVIHGNCGTADRCRAGDVRTTWGLDALVAHLVERGDVVVLPRYLRSGADPVPGRQTETVVAAIGAAVRDLAARDPRPDLTRLGLVGYSRGGLIAANVAALRPAALPPVAFVVAVAPGSPRVGGVPAEDWSRIPAPTVLVETVGEDDVSNGEGGAYARAFDIWARTGHLRRRQLFLVRGDAHGSPPLRADHEYPADAVVNALDRHAVWRPVDLAAACAFDGAGCAGLVSGAPSVRDMGSWPDGTPVRPLCVWTGGRSRWACA